MSMSQKIGWGILILFAWFMILGFFFLIGVVNKTAMGSSARIEWGNTNMSPKLIDGD